MSMTDSLTYADAGVDIDKADKLVGTISEIANQTPRMGVIGEIGGFGGLFSPNLANLLPRILRGGLPASLARHVRHGFLVVLTVFAPCAGDYFWQRLGLRWVT